MKAKLPIATTLHVGTTTNGSVRGGALVSSYVWTRPGLLFFQSTGADLELFWGFVLLSGLNQKSEPENNQRRTSPLHLKHFLLSCVVVSG